MLKVAQRPWNLQSLHSCTEVESSFLQMQLRAWGVGGALLCIPTVARKQMHAGMLFGHSFSEVESSFLQMQWHADANIIKTIMAADSTFNVYPHEQKKTRCKVKENRKQKQEGNSLMWW